MTTRTTLEASGHRFPMHDQGDGPYALCPICSVRLRLEETVDGHPTGLEAEIHIAIEHPRSES